MIDHHTALQELAIVLDHVKQDEFTRFCDAIGQTGHQKGQRAQKIVLYGCGREGLQMRGLAMRLYHLGFDATMVGDMSTPPLGAGDLFIVSSGPGDLSTVLALMSQAKKAGAAIFYITANPHTSEARLASQILEIPAQTMADDAGESARSQLPMGSIFEGALFILFEMVIAHLIAEHAIDPNEMRARHTNME